MLLTLLVGRLLKEQLSEPPWLTTGTQQIFIHSSVLACCTSLFTLAGLSWGGGKNQSLTQMHARKLKKAMQRQQPKREIKLRILHGTAALLLKKQQHLDCIMYILCSK